MNANKSKKFKVETTHTDTMKKKSRKRIIQVPKVKGKIPKAKIKKAIEEVFAKRAQG